jgi:hypothetical protein
MVMPKLQLILFTKVDCSRTPVGCDFKEFSLSVIYPFGNPLLSAVLALHFVDLFSLLHLQVHQHLTCEALKPATFDQLSVGVSTKSVYNSSGAEILDCKNLSLEGS